MLGALASNLLLLLALLLRDLRSLGLSLRLKLALLLGGLLLSNLLLAGLGLDQVSLLRLRLALLLCNTRLLLFALLCDCIVLRSKAVAALLLCSGLLRDLNLDRIDR